MDSALIASIAQLAFIFLVFCVFGLLTLIVHEFGHAVADLLCGFRIVWIRVRPVQFSPPGKWTWIWRWASLRSGGVLAQLREPPGPWTVHKYFLSILAGPLANIASALVVLPFSLGYTAFSGFCVLFVAASGLFALAQLLPFQTRQMTSDGAKLFWLLFSRKRRNDYLFLLTLTLRLEELVRVLREKRHDEAFRLADAFLITYRRIPFADINSEFVGKIAKIRDTLEEHRACGEVCQVSIVANSR